MTDRAHLCWELNRAPRKGFKSVLERPPCIVSSNTLHCEHLQVVDNCFGLLFKSFGRLVSSRIDLAEINWNMRPCLLTIQSVLVTIVLVLYEVHSFRWLYVLRHECLFNCLTKTKHYRLSVGELLLIACSCYMPESATHAMTFCVWRRVKNSPMLLD